MPASMYKKRAIKRKEMAKSKRMVTRGKGSAVAKVKAKINKKTK